MSCGEVLFVNFNKFQLIAYKMGMRQNRLNETWFSGFFLPVFYLLPNRYGEKIDQRVKTEKELTYNPSSG